MCFSSILAPFWAPIWHPMGSLAVQMPPKGSPMASQRGSRRVPCDPCFEPGGSGGSPGWIVDHFWTMFGIIVGVFLDCFGIIFRTCLEQFRIVLGAFLDGPPVIRILFLTSFLVSILVRVALQSTSLKKCIYIHT